LGPVTVTANFPFGDLATGLALKASMDIGGVAFLINTNGPAVTSPLAGRAFDSATAGLLKINALMININGARRRMSARTVSGSELEGRKEK
jgi:hypothetical protein